MYDPNQFKHLSLDEVRQRIMDSHTYLTAEFSGHDVEEAPIRFLKALQTIADNALQLQSQADQLPGIQRKYLDPILRTTHLLYFWLQESESRYPGLQRPLDARVTNAQLTPSQFFWLMAVYDIRTPIGVLQGYCNLLANDGLKGEQFENLRAAAVELWESFASP